MSLDALLAGGARFGPWWQDRDVTLLPRSVPGADAAVFATDRSGGEYVSVDAAGSERPGVWLRGSEGQRLWLAASPIALLEQLARGFTVADLAAGRATPSGRPGPGVIRWLATIEH